VRIPYPILLVVGGSVLGFVPGIPEVELEPDLVLVIFLPPLLFHQAYFSSLRDLRRDMRTITLSAVGLVLVTMAIVAVVLHAVIDGLPWAAAFAFGAIVAPTDPLAASEICRRLGVPRRLVTMVEGESLINDGTALVAYSTAVAAAAGMGFGLGHAVGAFATDAAGGIGVGLVVGALLQAVSRRLPDDPLLVTTVTLVYGFAAYLPAERLGVSGVLAAVTCGLVLGRSSDTISTVGARMAGYMFWEVLVFLLNATLFVLVGLQLRTIVEEQDRSLGELLALGALASVAVVGARLVWLNTTPYLIRMLDRRPSQRTRRVGWRGRMVSLWAGMRGAVSLAAALALPPGFPERELLVFLALCVIFVTLVGQGLTLGGVIRLLGVRDDGGAEREDLHARKAATAAALARIEELAAEEWTREDTLERMRGLYAFRQRRLRQRAVGLDDGDEDLEDRSMAYQRTVRELLEAQRRAVAELRNLGEISDDVMHRIERELDLEDGRLEI
jgi:CPA1 family monovalent cation:H+ antiporter